MSARAPPGDYGLPFTLGSFFKSFVAPFSSGAGFCLKGRFDAPGGCLINPSTFRCGNSRAFTTGMFAGGVAAGGVVFCRARAFFRWEFSWFFCAASFARRSESCCVLGSSALGFRCDSSRAFAAESAARGSDCGEAFFSDPRVFRSASSWALAPESFARGCGCA
jgi:hypothetical protein